MMARPSAARPAVPTTNWCPMSSLTNLYTYLCYYLPLLLSCVSAQCRLLFEIFLLPSERGDERSDGDVFNLRSPGKLIFIFRTFCLLPGLKLRALVWLVFWLVLSQYLIYLLTSSVFALHVTIHRGIRCGLGHNCLNISSTLQFTLTHVLYNVTLGPLTPFIWNNKISELLFMDVLHSLDISLPAVSNCWLVNWHKC